MSRTAMQMFKTSFKPLFGDLVNQANDEMDIVCSESEQQIATSHKQTSTSDNN